MSSLLEVQALTVSYRVPRRGLRRAERQAVVDANLTVGRGEIVGLVGESGSGKSTLARAIARLLVPRAGQIQFDGLDWLALDAAQLRAHRHRLQMVFQDPTASLDPRMTIGRIVEEPLRHLQPALQRAERRAAAHRMLSRVGLSADDARRLPREFSGGQCQRIAIARACVSSPRLLVCDEPVSALDVSIRGQVLNLLKLMQAEQGGALLFITHDLTVLRRFAQRVYVMWAGRLVESAATETLFQDPQHPYTQALLRGEPMRKGGADA